jgi:putative DNA primase/helicase
MELVPFEPTKYKIANVVDALQAIGYIDQAAQPPMWLKRSITTPINAGEIVPVANGILDFATRELRGHTPELFFGHVLPFAFHPRAPRPVRWLARSRAC